MAGITGENPGYTDGFAMTAPVGSYKPAPSGIYDLGGNVWEWCEDWFDASQVSYTLRGSSWDNSETSLMISSRRLGNEHTRLGPTRGFRCVLGPPTHSASASPIIQSTAPSPVATPTASPVPLFDGKTLKGWELRPANFPASVEDGAMRIGGAAGGQDGSIYYRGFGPAMPQFINYEVTLSAKTEKGGNSGMYIHGSPGALDGRKSNGIEVQIMNSHPQTDANLYTGGLQNVRQITNQGVQDGEWFDMKVRVEGKRVQVWLKTAKDSDWRKVNDWTQSENWVPPAGKDGVRLGSGTVSFQNWTPEQGFTLLKDIRVQVLP
jgi:hypothetical protein